MVGSFLNVLVARLPFEKSIVWPGSRCFTCFRPIRLTDNLPIIGYLWLGGKCRYCRTPYSARYLWVEVGTGLGFLGLFILEILVNPTGMPGVRYDIHGDRTWPTEAAVALFVYHACLLSLLIAAAVIDAEHRIIPPLIPYTGVVIGIIGGTLMPWPFPHGADALTIPGTEAWFGSQHRGKIPIGVQPWPYWGPLLDATPAGTWKLGLANALIGALAGSLVVRGVKWLFETGFGNDALGLGDADLLMMAGAFLGWQIAVFSLFVGAFAALFVFKLPGMILALIRKSSVERELPFGPGLVVGVLVCWLGWPWLGPRVQFPLFDLEIMAVLVSFLSIGMLAAGLLLRRKE